MKLAQAVFYAPLAAGCAWRQGALQPLGPRAATIAELGALFFWITLLVLASILMAAAWAFARGARRSGDTAAPQLLDAAVERKLEKAVWVSTLVALLLLAVLLVASVATGQKLADFEANRPLRVKVTGHQWWWKLEYPGEKPSDLVVTANELHVPVGTPIELELTSADVIHSFWVPNLHGKRDLIPSHTTKLVFQADSPGRYAGRCAEFCGYQHTHMDIVIVAETPTEFGAWLAGQRDYAREPTTPQAARGKQLVESRACALCHTVSGTRALGGTGPDLSHFASRSTLGAGAAARDAEALRHWIENPQALKPGVQMPAVPLSRDDLAAVVTYLEGLQ
jgi:cytochrome c oxidase subunit 2